MEISDDVCKNVGPVLALLGGVDPGLRVGGKCKQLSINAVGYVLGSAKLNSDTVKIQLEDSSIVSLQKTLS